MLTVLFNGLDVVFDKLSGLLSCMANSFTTVGLDTNAPKVNHQRLLSCGKETLTFMLWALVDCSETNKEKHMSYYPLAVSE